MRRKRKCGCAVGGLVHSRADGGSQIELCIVKAAADALKAGGCRIAERCRDARVGVVGHFNCVAAVIVDLPDTAFGVGGFWVVGSQIPASAV